MVGPSENTYMVLCRLYVSIYIIILLVDHLIIRYHPMFQIEPYVTLYNDSIEASPESYPRSSKYYGYMVDMLDSLGAVVRFRYVLQPVVDGQFGFARPDGTGQWTGMVG